MYALYELNKYIIHLIINIEFIIEQNIISYKLIQVNYKKSWAVIIIKIPQNHKLKIEVHCNGHRIDTIIIINVML